MSASNDDSVPSEKKKSSHVQVRPDRILESSENLKVRVILTCIFNTVSLHYLKKILYSLLVAVNVFMMNFPISAHRVGYHLKTIPKGSICWLKKDRRTHTICNRCHKLTLVQRLLRIPNSDSYRLSLAATKIVEW